MKRRKLIIKPSEVRMLQNLKRIPRSLTVNELADKSNISWATADKYLKKWRRKGLVKPVSKPIFSQTKKRIIKRKEWTVRRTELNRILAKRRPLRRMVVRRRVRR